jgi:hypothetical protein
MSKLYVSTYPRPYTLTILETGSTYPATSEEVERLLLDAHFLMARPNKVVIQQDTVRVMITPATLGGGPEFDRYWQ